MPLVLVPPFPPLIVTSLFNASAVTFTVSIAPPEPPVPLPEPPASPHFTTKFADGFVVRFTVTAT